MITRTKLEYPEFVLLRDQCWNDVAEKVLGPGKLIIDHDGGFWWEHVYIDRAERKRPDTIGDKWRDGLTLVTDPETRETATISVEQGEKGKPSGNLEISTTNVVFALVSLDDKSWDRLGDFCHNAAHMLRQCST